MKALILNSGIGQRMGALTSTHPKCMTFLTENDTILSRQLKLIEQSGIKEVVMTTGLFEQSLIDYCNQLRLDLTYTFIHNPVYDKTNYIYSVFLARSFLEDDILLMHGDLVFEHSLLPRILKNKNSCMTVSTTLSLPEKDFKAVVCGKQILKVGIEFFTNTVSAQPLYKLNKKDWMIWLERIGSYCDRGMVTCYAENALNEVTDRCYMECFDTGNSLCCEIDTMEDLQSVKERVNEF